LALVHTECPDLNFVSSQQVQNCVANNSDFVRVRPGLYFVSNRCRVASRTAGSAASDMAAGGTGSASTTVSGGAAELPEGLRLSRTPLWGAPPSQETTRLVRILEATGYPTASLGLTPGLYAAIERLGIKTVGDLILTEASVVKRQLATEADESFVSLIMRRVNERKLAILRDAVRRLVKHPSAAPKPDATTKPAASVESRSKTPCSMCEQAKLAALALISAEARPAHIEDVAHSVSVALCAKCGSELSSDVDGSLMQRLLRGSTQVIVDGDQVYRLEVWRLSRSKKLVEAVEGALSRLGGKARASDVAATIRDHSDVFSEVRLDQVRSCLYAQSYQRRRFVVLGDGVFCLPNCVPEGAERYAPKSHVEILSSGPREAVHAYQIVLRDD
jgi:hypothetical protein